MSAQPTAADDQPDAERKAGAARPAPRSLSERVRDARHRLAHDVDVWVASAGAAGGDPHLVPLSFAWDGTELLLATPTDSPTGRNLRASGRARVALGVTRDVVMIEGAVRATAAEELDAETADAFAARTGFEPRRQRKPHHYFRVRPERVQAWREANEIAGRELMRDGEWLAEPAGDRTP